MDRPYYFTVISDNCRFWLWHCLSSAISMWTAEFMICLQNCLYCPQEWLMIIWH